MEAKENLSEGFHGGRDETARTAPSSDELNKNRTVSLQHRVFELGLVDLRHSRTACHRKFWNRRGMIPETESCSVRGEPLPGRGRPGVSERNGGRG